MGDTIHISGLQSLLPPEPVGGWPPAPGWYVVAALMVVFMVAVIFRIIKKRRINAYRRMALSNLASLKDDRSVNIGPDCIQRFNYILKQTALYTYPRSQVASLSGRDWIRFLKESCPAFQLSDEQKTLLSLDGYRKGEEVNMAQSVWIELVRQGEIWVRSHRRGG